MLVNVVLISFITQLQLVQSAGLATIISQGLSAVLAFIISVRVYLSYSLSSSISNGTKKVIRRSLARFGYGLMSSIVSTYSGFGLRLIPLRSIISPDGGSHMAFALLP